MSAPKPWEAVAGLCGPKACDCDSGGVGVGPWWEDELKGYFFPEVGTNFCVNSRCHSA